MLNRLDNILADYDKERENATTYQELQQAANKVVERIEALPGEKTPIELLVLALFRGLSQWSSS